MRRSPTRGQPEAREPQGEGRANPTKAVPSGNSRTPAGAPRRGSARAPCPCGGAPWSPVAPCHFYSRKTLSGDLVFCLRGPVVRARVPSLEGLMVTQSQILLAGQLGTLSVHRSCSCSKDTGLSGLLLSYGLQANQQGAGVLVRPHLPTPSPGLWALLSLPEMPSAQQAGSPCSDPGWACHTASHCSERRPTASIGAHQAASQPPTGLSTFSHRVRVVRL